MAAKLERYIKDSSGSKVEMETTSVNLTRKQKLFLKKKNLNLSLIVRERVEELMKEAGIEPEPKDDL